MGAPTRVATVVLDLDGTLSVGAAPLRRYARDIAERLPSDARAAFTRAAEAHISGEVRLPGADDWQVLAALARASGIAHAALAAAFQSTRAAMRDGTCLVCSPHGTARFLAEARAYALIAVVSNSPADSVGPVLARLGLEELVDAVAPSAQKPDGLVPTVRALVLAHGMSERPVLSVGDNAQNDILPARAAGWRTAYVRAGRPACAAATWSGDGLEELMAPILAWLMRLKAGEEGAALSAGDRAE